MDRLRFRPHEPRTSTPVPRFQIASWRVLYQHDSIISAILPGKPVGDTSLEPTLQLFVIAEWQSMAAAGVGCTVQGYGS